MFLMQPRKRPYEREMSVDIKNPKKTKTIEEWDFVSVSGMVWPVTLNLEAGDTIEYTPGDPVAVLRVKEKPSPISNEEIQSAEEVIVPMHNVFVVRHRTRQIEELTREEKEVWQKDLKDLMKTSALKGYGILPEREEA